MGLDMFVFATRQDINDVDFDTPLSDEFEIFYWRKHPNLHGWFNKLYDRKGGYDEEGFIGPVRILLSDLDELESDIKQSKLPFTDGFFFGQSKNTDYEEENDLKFVNIARNFLEIGYNIYYISSW